jgi:integrase
MEPLLVRWFAYYRARKGNVEGKLAPANLRRRLRGIRAAAGIEEWPADAPRRTYASCWLAVHENIDLLCRRLGHTSSDMLWRHYNKAVPRKQALAFWRIGPPKLPKGLAPAAPRKRQEKIINLLAA